MTSGARTATEPARLRGVLAALAGLLASDGAQALDLPELMRLLAHRPSEQVRFTEQRFVKGLDAPLVSSGLPCHRLGTVAPPGLA